MPEVGGKVLESVKALILPELAAIKQDLVVISSRLEGIDKRFDDLRQDLNQRLSELRADLDKRVADFRGDVNQRWGEFRSDVQQSFEINRKEAQMRLDVMAANVTELLARHARLEDDLKQIREQKVYQEIVIQEHQRALEEMRLKFEEQKARLDLLEKEVLKKLRSVTAKKTAA